MADLQRLQAQIDSLADLQNLFAAMQAIAASRVQSAQAALEGIGSYKRVVERALSDVAALQARPSLPEPLEDDTPTSGLLLVICSEHGFAGAFNRLLLEQAKAAATADERIAIVGLRGAALASELEIKPIWSRSMAAHADGVVATARKLAVELSGFGRLRVVFARHEVGARYRPETRQILPPDPSLLKPSQTGQLPLHHLEPLQMLRQLISELLLAELTHAMMHSFASENTARLQVMQAANQNITVKIDSLNGAARQERQAAITSELIEIITGSDAIAAQSR